MGVDPEKGRKERDREGREKMKRGRGKRDRAGQRNGEGPDKPTSRQEGERR